MRVKDSKNKFFISENISFLNDLLNYNDCECIVDTQSVPLTFNSDCETRYMTVNVVSDSDTNLDLSYIMESLLNECDVSSENLSHNNYRTITIKLTKRFKSFGFFVVDDEVQRMTLKKITIALYACGANYVTMEFMITKDDSPYKLTKADFSDVFIEDTLITKPHFEGCFAYDKRIDDVIIFCQGSFITSLKNTNNLKRTTSNVADDSWYLMDKQPLSHVTISKGNKSIERFVNSKIDLLCVKSVLAYAVQGVDADKKKNIDLTYFGNDIVHYSDIFRRLKDNKLPMYVSVDPSLYVVIIDDITETNLSLTIIKKY